MKFKIEIFGINQNLTKKINKYSWKSLLPKSLVRESGILRILFACES